MHSWASWDEEVIELHLRAATDEEKEEISNEFTFPTAEETEISVLTLAIVMLFLIHECL
jgi:hypothetical protein